MRQPASDTACDCGAASTAPWLHEEWCAWRLYKNARASRASEIGIAYLELQSRDDAHDILSTNARDCGRRWATLEGPNL